MRLTLKNGTVARAVLIPASLLVFSGVSHAVTVNYFSGYTVPSLSGQVSTTDPLSTQTVSFVPLAQSVGTSTYAQPTTTTSYSTPSTSYSSVVTGGYTDYSAPLSYSYSSPAMSYSYSAPSYSYSAPSASYSYSAPASSYATYASPSTTSSYDSGYSWVTGGSYASVGTSPGYNVSAFVPLAGYVAPSVTTNITTPVSTPVVTGPAQSFGTGGFDLGPLDAPEPSSIILLGAGLLALAGFARKLRKA